MLIGLDEDGIYCKKCHELHPTLFWHEKYDDYLEYEEWADRRNIALRHLGLRETMKQMQIAHKTHLKSLSIRYCIESRECVICGDQTHFCHFVSDRFLCSDECRYADCAGIGLSRENNPFA